MANGINFTGLASGVDTASIVTQLMQLEQAPVTRMTNQIDVENARKSALQDISTKLLSLRTAADSLRNVAFWAGAPHGTSGDDSSYTLDASSGAPKATYQVQVKRLATRVVYLEHGRLLADLPVQDFFNGPQLRETSLEADLFVKGELA